MEKEDRSEVGFWRGLWQEVKENKSAFLVFVCLWAATLGVLLGGVLAGEWQRVFTGVLCLLLFLVPPFVERSFSLQLPAALEISAYLFVFCAGVLGEIGDFYQRFPAWDAMLHAANGFLFAGFGLCLFSLFEKKRRVQTLPSPAYQSFTAFCFSMTVGVLWEIFEFAADYFLHTDMQKDSFLTSIHSVLVPGEDGGVFRVENIVQVEIKAANGASFSLPAYLDVGLADTVKDLVVNLWGAMAFCIIGYFWLKKRRVALAAQFIPRVRERM
ncbi:MAG: hypothetical protein J6U87_05115 [Clostridia bacterium]|nr:hypothetical protein [Clostridia bacterium]